MSPVMMKGSGLPLATSKVTVVSSVLGKQLAKSQASSGSAMAETIRATVESTASLTNFRLARGGRLLSGIDWRLPPDCATCATVQHLLRKIGRDKLCSPLNSGKILS